MNELEPLTDPKEILAMCYAFALRKHYGQTRYGGEPYFSHPLYVASKIDRENWQARAVAFLHDVIEDTDATYTDLFELRLPRYIISAVEALTRKSGEEYDVYIEKEKELVSRMSQLENLEIPASFDYKKILSLGNEAREKLSRIQPRTLGQASRISGINPSDVQILMVYMGR